MSRQGLEGCPILLDPGLRITVNAFSLHLLLVLPSQSKSSVHRVLQEQFLSSVLLSLSPLWSNKAYCIAHSGRRDDVGK